MTEVDVSWVVRRSTGPAVIMNWSAWFIYLSRGPPLPFRVFMAGIIRPKNEEGFRKVICFMLDRLPRRGIKADAFTSEATSRRKDDLLG